MRDVIVIGAGLAGSGAAAALGRAGWDVLLVEQRRLPRHKVCGEFLSPESQASLRALGLHAAVAALSPATIQHAMLVSRRGVALGVALPGEAWGVSRFALDAALAEGAARAGVEVWQGSSVTALDVTPEQARVTVRAAAGEQVVCARVALVAGGRNLPRGLRDAGEPPRQKLAIGVKAHYQGVARLAQVELFLFDGGYAGLSPVEGGRANVCLLASHAAFQRAGATPQAMLNAASAWNPALRARLAGATLLPETLCTVAAVDTERIGAPWRQTAQLGDAAAMIPPLCGDGMAMALRSAELCAPLLDDLLRGKRDFAAWQASYRQAWHGEFDARLRVARLLQRALVVPGLADVCLWAGRMVPPLAARLVHATRGQMHEPTTAIQL